MMNSDLPEPVIPAIRPCGPCTFSCKSSLNNSLDLSNPIQLNIYADQDEDKIMEAIKPYVVD